MNKKKRKETILLIISKGADVGEKWCSQSLGHLGNTSVNTFQNKNYTFWSKVVNKFLCYFEMYSIMGLL